MARKNFNVKGSFQVTPPDFKNGRIILNEISMNSKKFGNLGEARTFMLEELAKVREEALEQIKFYKYQLDPADFGGKSVEVEDDDLGLL